MELRQYQLECIEAVWTELFQEPTALTVLPTGAGKTFVLANLMKKAIEAKADIRIAMVMGRIELVRQTERALSSVIPLRDIGVYCGSLGRRELQRRVTVASIQSIADIKMENLNLLVIDEVHNFDQSRGAYLRFVERAREETARLKVVGVTATAFRATGMIYGPGQLFKRVCYRKTIQEMIALGFLAKPKLKSSAAEFDTSRLRTRAGEYMQEDVDELVSNERTCQEQVSDALSRLQGRTTVAWATANIAHCNMVADTLMAKGERVTTVHSKLSTLGRQQNLASWMTGQTRHMVFVTVLSEGFDHPPIDAVCLMRPTRSPVLYVQTVGRGLRTWPGKEDCLILDYGQVVKTLGPIDDPLVSDKDSKSKRKLCKKCQEPNPIGNDFCDACGFPFPPYGLKCCPQCLSFVPGGAEVCEDCAYAFPPLPEPREIVKKLDKKAQEHKILSERQAPERVTLGPAWLSMHTAKSGNECVRITYRDLDLMNNWGGLSEFFVVTSPWAMERLERRLGELGAQLPGVPFEDTITVQGTFEIVKTKEGKYDRVLSVKRISDESPKDEPETAKASLGGWEGIFDPPSSSTDIGF